MLTRHTVKKIARSSVFILIFLIVIGYAIFAFHDFILGPTINIFDPANGSTSLVPTITIKGIVKRIQDISLNDRPITIDDKGNFSEMMALAPGYNVFTLAVKDKFGRNKTDRLEIIYKVN